LRGRCRVTEASLAMMVLMTRLFTAFTCVVLALIAHAQDRAGLAEALGLEAPRAGACPTGWSCHPPETIAADSEVVHTGKWSVRMERQPGRTEPFSTVTKGLPIDFGGATIELRGFVRTEDVKDFSAFWMREDGPSGSVAFASMQQTQPVKGTTPWTAYSISLPLNSEATDLVFGFLLSGPGKAWAGDLLLLVDGKPVADAPKVAIVKTALDTDHEFDGSSRISLNSLTAVQIANLATLGKVWGFLKYHDLRITTGKRQFDYDLFRVLPAILAAPDRSAANAALVHWMAGLGDSVDCTVCAKLDESKLYLRPDLDWISGETALGADLSRSLRRIRDNRPAGGKQFYVSLTPIANPSFDHELNYASVQLPDAGFQILALFRYWNIIEYWYPYRDAIGADWGAVLTEFLPRIALAKDRDSYQREMMALIARVNDTHANLWSSLAVQPPLGACQLPVNVRFVENQAVVAGYSNTNLGKATGLKPGDVIQKLDGTEVPKLVSEWTPLYAASNQPTRLRDIGRSLTRGDCAKPATLRIRRASQTLDLSATRVSPRELDSRTFATHDQPGATFRLLSKDVAYLKLSSVKLAEAAHYIDSAAGTKGLIIDIRNYPAQFMVFALGQLLVDRPTEFARFTQGDLANPGAFHWGVSEKLEPQKPHYAGKIAILVDEVTVSQAEYTAMAFRSEPGAVVIGSTTAGADGNVSQIPRPGALHTMISGIGVFYPDQKPTQRIGIVPDQGVKPTIAGLRDGRDEILEAAIRHLLGPDTPEAAILQMATPQNPEPAPSNEFSDEQSGISLKLPAGWGAQDPFHWGDQQTTVALTGAPSGSAASLYFQVFHDRNQLTEEEIHKDLDHQVEAKQEQRRREGRGNYTIRTGSCSARTVSGRAALSCVADFDEGGRAMAEYLTFVRTGKLLVLFFGQTPAAGLDAYRQSLDRVIETISIP